MLSICLIEAVAFLDLLAVGMIVPVAAAHVQSLGGTHIHVGLLGSLYSGFQLFSSPLIGSLSDLQGRKPVLLITLLICSLAYAGFGLTKSIFVILAVRALLGIFKQTQMLTKALVPDYEKDECKQSGIYGKMAAISGAGITLGPVIGGHIADQDPENGFSKIAVIVAACFILNAVLVYFLPSVDSRKKSSRRKVEHNSVLNSATQTFVHLYRINWSKYWDVFLAKALMGFAMSIFYSNYSLYLKNQYELSPKHIGYIISFQGVIGSISSFFMGFINSFYLHDKDYSIRNLHMFLTLSISLIGMILSFNVITYTFWLIPLAVGNAVGRLATLEMVLNRSHGDNAGTLIGASNSVRSLSGVIAPMVAGFVGEYVGLNYVIYASLCSTTIGVLLSYWNKSKTKVD